MTAARHAPDARTPVTIHLLDSSQGHPVQTWRISDQSAITIGRSEDADIVIADPHVSRTHVKLQRQGEAWTLVSLGRHGTLVNDRLVAEIQLGQQATFRLGANGPLSASNAVWPRAAPAKPSTRYIPI